MLLFFQKVPALLLASLQLRQNSVNLSETGDDTLFLKGGFAEAC
jgi:hypothetical protein